MIIWETIGGELTPLVFCDCCGWDCTYEKYEEVDNMILCPNCIRQNNAETVVEGVIE